MHDTYGDVLIIFALCAVALYLCNVLRIPTIVGLLVIGVAAGPKGLRFVHAPEAVSAVSELGVILLLFTIGIEFSLRDMLRIRKHALLGGALQVGLTTLAVAAIARAVGIDWGRGVFAGLLVAGTSTTIMMKLLLQRAELDAPQGRTALAISIFQDLASVLMVMATPLLAGGAPPGLAAAGIAVAKGLGIVVLTFIAARWALPTILHRVARVRDSDLFLMSVIVIGLGIAWLTARTGLSPALGAFLAGLILSESDYADRALGNILPFRDVFMALFFVSIGMMFDVRVLIERPAEILALAVGAVALKTFVAGQAALLLGLPLRVSFLVGVALAQIGEFSFVVSEAGLREGLIDEGFFQTFLGVAVLTMMASPFLVDVAGRVAGKLDKLPLPERWKTGSLAARPPEVEAPTQDHLVIVGFGVNGRNVARAAVGAGVAYVVVEMNPDTVREERAKGEPIQYGDAAHEAVLRRAGLPTARVLVVAISDAPGTRRVIEVARRTSPSVQIIVRTRLVREIKPLLGLGADKVIPEEFETSIEIFTWVLQRYLVPESEIEKCVEEIRSDGYKMLRSPRPLRKTFGELADLLQDVEVRTMRVAPGSEAEGRTLGDLDLRRRAGVTVVAIRRGGALATVPGAGERLSEGDAAILLGPAERIIEAARLFEGKATAPSASR